MKYITDQHRQQYYQDGFFILPSVIPSEHLLLLQEQCSSATAEMDRQMDQQGTDTLGINHRGKRYFVGQSWRSYPQLGTFLFSELMQEICLATVGPDAFLHSDQYVVKCEREGMSFSWHQDGAYVHARIGDHPECITCWCTLDDVSEENGTVFILPASRYDKRELVPHQKDSQTNDRVGYFGDDPGDPIVAPAGSIAVFSSLVFHRSGANPSGKQRRVYLAQYSPAPIQNLPGHWPQYFAQPFLEGGEVIAV